MLYFAYGSNMDVAHLSNRLGHLVSPLGKAMARGWQFGYCGQSVNWQNASVANIVANQDKASVVWGICYELSETDFEHLDIFEHVKQGHYHRVGIEVWKDDSATPIRAIGYVMNQARRNGSGKPTNAYRRLCVESARRAGIDEDYIRKFLLS